MSFTKVVFVECLSRARKMGQTFMIYCSHCGAGIVYDLV